MRVLLTVRTLNVRVRHSTKRQHREQLGLSRHISLIASWITGKFTILVTIEHDVVATVRSNEKADKIQKNHQNLSRRRLTFAIVEDISQPDAFDEAVRSDPPFDAVIHTASPFRYHIDDAKDFLDPAIKGTNGILNAIKNGAPNVKRVILTSSFAAVIDLEKEGTGYVYSEKDWNPVTIEQVIQDPTNAYLAYRASKTFAEKAAWDFVKNDNPAFTLTTICPPFVFGPTASPLTASEHLNTSNFVTRDFLRGDFKSEIPETGDFIWVDVRDLALGHVRALEIPEAAQKRFFFTAGHFNNRQIAEAIRDNFPEFRDKLPTPEVAGGDFPKTGLLGLAPPPTAAQKT